MLSQDMLSQEFEAVKIITVLTRDYRFVKDQFGNIALWNRGSGEAAALQSMFESNDIDSVLVPVVLSEVEE